MNVSFLQELLNTVAEQGRALLPKSLFRGDAEEGIQALVGALMSGRGEASGVAIAQQLLAHYRVLDERTRNAFFRYLAVTLQPDSARIETAAREYLAHPSTRVLSALQDAVESPLQEFFRRLNLAPGATAQIVAMRADLLAMDDKDGVLSQVDGDVRHLLYSWFNRGFLVLRRIDWQTSAAILERLMAYEAVHEIRGWEDLRRRLDPDDRRCFGFFHPSLVDDPLIFVQVALTKDIPDAIAPVLEEARKNAAEPAPTTAVFYSISNCQPGLKGISFGNFLIKQVVEDLVREIPSLKTFVTLSPVPKFSRWLADVLAEEDTSEDVTGFDRKLLKQLEAPDWQLSLEADSPLQDALKSLAATYFLKAKASDGKPIDPVARFHLGNGARLERINWLGDLSEKGIAQSHGLMVNYRYDLKEIERNHEAYANSGHVAASRSVRGLLRSGTLDFSTFGVGSKTATQSERSDEGGGPAAVIASSRAITSLPEDGKTPIDKTS